MSSAELPEELVTLVQVLAEDDALRGWFERVGAASDVVRVAELHRVAGEMEAGGEEARLVKAVRLLAHPHVFQGACAALKAARQDK